MIEAREGLFNAFLIVNNNRAVSTEGGDFQGHYHAVIVLGGVVATFEKFSAEESLAEAFSANHHFIGINGDFDAHLRQHFHNRFAAIAFFVCQTTDTADTTFARTECCQN